MTVMNKWHYSLFLCVLSALVLPFLQFLPTTPFKLETSVWCLKDSNQTKLCKFKNICYDSQFKTFLFFLGEGSVIKGFGNYSALQKILLSSVEEHNQFYANLSLIHVENYKVTKKLRIQSKGLLFSRFKPNNIMHSIHDDIFPVFLTLESVCLGDLQCFESYTLIFHDNYPEGPFFNLYKLFSKYSPVILNKLKLNSNFILCFEELLTGLVKDGVFYQYGFKKPHGPVKTTRLTQNDVLRFTSFIKEKLQINKRNNVSEVVLLKREKNRKILNIDTVKKMVEDTYKRLSRKTVVNVISLDLYSSDLKTMISTISQADGLIGMHGAEMILSLFLKPKSFAFEIFPFGIKPEVVSFIKPISELDGSNFIYFPWRNMLRNGSVPHPDAHPHFGGILHLDEVTQNKIINAQDVPPVQCCNNPHFLYYMYQDTFVSDKFQNYLYDSLKKVFNDKINLKSGLMLENWFYPHTVHNISCSFQLHRNLLHINWESPFNVENNRNLWYSLYIQDQNRLFAKEISTDKTIVKLEVPVGVNPVFELWISAYFRSNNFKGPDLYVKCY